MFILKSSQGIRIKKKFCCLYKQYLKAEISRSISVAKWGFLLFLIQGGSGEIAGQRGGNPRGGGGMRACPGPGEESGQEVLEVSGLKLEPDRFPYLW